MKTTRCDVASSLVFTDAGESHHVLGHGHQFNREHDSGLLLLEWPHRCYVDLRETSGLKRSPPGNRWALLRKAVKSHFDLRIQEILLGHYGVDDVLNL